MTSLAGGTGSTVVPCTIETLAQEQRTLTALGKKKTDACSLRAMSD